ncbi:unnamed protein product, partial [marine sediment metagenome]
QPIGCINKNGLGITHIRGGYVSISKDAVH